MTRNSRKKNRFGFLTRKSPERTKNKLLGLFFCVLVCFFILLVRISYICIVKGSVYTKNVLNQQVYDNRTIAFKRGDILDCNGTALAVSNRVYNVVLDVYQMTYDEAYVEPTIQVLGEYFQIEAETVRQTIEENPDSRYEILLKNVAYEQANQFLTMQETSTDEMEEGEAEKWENVKGVWLEENYQRSYPYGSLASDVIGFASASNEGVIGLENEYNEELNGVDGQESGYMADTVSMERVVREPENGNSIVTTIDAGLQEIVEQCIDEYSQTYETDGKDNASQNTAVILMDPNNGDILAEASYPNFDLNSPQSLTNLYSDQEWEAMSEEEQEDALSDLWTNFCVSDTYEPGSTAKPFTVATGLETGKISGDEEYLCQGSLYISGYDIACHLRSGHGTVTVENAIAYSCNVGLMNIAKTVGIEDFCRYQQIFGFGQYTGIDLPGEADTSGLLYTADTMTEIDLMTNSFGQTFNVTMTQLVSAFSSLVNGGYYYQPRLVKEIQDEDGNTIETKSPQLLRRTVSTDTSEQLKTYLKAVMEYGTGSSINTYGYDVGGKTGTAEKLPRGNGKYLLSFIGYAPQENPEVVIYVVIDEANVSQQDQSSLVFTLTQMVMERAFPYLGITQTSE